MWGFFVGGNCRDAAIQAFYVCPFGGARRGTLDSDSSDRRLRGNDGRPGYGHRHSRKRRLRTRRLSTYSQIASLDGSQTDLANPVITITYN